MRSGARTLNTLGQSRHLHSPSLLHRLHHRFRVYSRALSLRRGATLTCSAAQCLCTSFTGDRNKGNNTDTSSKSSRHISKNNTSGSNNNCNIRTSNYTVTMPDNKAEGETRLRAVLDKLSITLPTIEHEPKRTVDSANKELSRFDVACVGTKNMFLKSKKDELILLTALHTTSVDLKRVATETNTKALRFAPEELLLQTLGVEPGSVTPFALVNTDRRDILVVLDKNIMDSSIPFVLHPCRNDKSCLVTPEQLQRVIAHLGVTVKTVDFASPGPVAASSSSSSSAAAATAATAAPAASKAKAKTVTAGHADPEARTGKSDVTGESKLGISKRREVDFAAWYTEVIVKGEMIDYYDVSGCYIIRPLAMYVWKSIQRFLGDRIEAMGVQDCYFPMFVSKSCLEREKDHIEGFAPEVAWVTRAGDTDLEAPVAIRPTSETIMYPYYAKWIRSHRDLPVRMNMWNSVIRWEFSHPMPFIRTREFLWQEGHCAWSTKEECAREVTEIQELYASVYESLLAVPVVRGVKTDKERFAGAMYTTTVETFVPPVGRGCQGGTSHHLGQNFGKIFNLRFQDPDQTDGSTLIPWQNSWGLSTRTIGVMIMVHGDNQGLVMPPRVAMTQIVIIPVGITKDTTEAQRSELIEQTTRLEGELMQANLRAKADLRLNYSPGWRFNDAEVKGVPVRVELGPKELQSRQLQVVLRCNGERRTVVWDGAVAASMSALLDETHTAMYHRARAIRDAHMRHVTEWSEFVPTLNNKCIILSPWCGSEACEDAVKKDSNEESKAAMAQQEAAEDARAPSMGAKTLCIPHEQPALPPQQKCICQSCNNRATKWVLFGRSY